MNPAVPQRNTGSRGRWLSLRARLLAGSFLLVFCAWSIDTLGHERGPKRASAAQSTPAAGAFVIADPPDRAMLDRFLADHEPPPQPLIFDMPRDPFAAPEDWQVAAIAPRKLPESQPVETRIAETAGPARTERPFSEAHQLQGVVVGTRPLALIDGNGYRMGDWIDGYQIVALSRNQVELRGRRGRVVMRVAEAELKPTRNSP